MKLLTLYLTNCFLVSTTDTSRVNYIILSADIKHPNTNTPYLRHTYFIPNFSSAKFLPQKSVLPINPLSITEGYDEHEGTILFTLADSNDFINSISSTIRIFVDSSSLSYLQIWKTGSNTIRIEQISRSGRKILESQSFDFETALPMKIQTSWKSGKLDMIINSKTVGKFFYRSDENAIALPS